MESTWRNKVPIDGVWDLTISTPVGSLGGMLRLTLREGALTGEIRGRDDARCLLGGEVIGSDVFWTVDSATEAIEFSGSVDGGIITGEIRIGDLTDATFIAAYVGPDSEVTREKPECICSW